MQQRKLKEILSIPNIFTYVRFLLIPLIVYSYAIYKNYLLAAALIAFSFVTDVADGYIARHFNMVTDLGKIIDPIADKLTQLAIVVCLTTKYPLILTLLIIILVKEISIGIITLIAIKRTKVVPCAKWYGKIATGVFYISTIIIIIVKNLPEVAADTMIFACCATVVFSLIMYAITFTKILHRQSLIEKETSKDLTE